MVKRISLVIIVIGTILAIVSGCGGGGGGGGKATLTVATDWTLFGNPISGNSTKWSLFDKNDSFLRSVAINRDNPGLQSSSFTDVDRGTYHLRVELFANRDLGGGVVGMIDEQISVSGSLTYTAVVGTTPTSIKVTPTSATFKAGQAKQFFVAGYNSSNKPTFIAPGTITWQTFGGVATVDENGFVQGTAAGPGNVVATHGPTSLQGGATITIQSNTTTTGKWTVLVYMNAANDLDQFSDLNVNQLEKVAGNPDVRYVVQWKQAVIPGVSDNPSFTGTRRYLIKQDTTNSIASELVQNMGNNVDMGDKSTLNEFINWGKTFYPAQHYVLVVWNHGNGWRRGVERNYPTRAVSYDDEFGTSIQTWELAQAIGNNHFDMIAWDASLMQMIEVAHEIKDQADYIVGSEESPPGAGYPYDLIFAKFRDNPDDTPLNLSKSFVDGMLQGYASDNLAKITQSVIDTSQLSNLATQVDGLAQVLIANQGSLGSLVPSVRANAKSYSPTGGRVYRDLQDVCERLKAGTSIVPLQTACDNVLAAIGSTIKWEGHNANSAGSHGISIDFSSSSQFGSVASDYANLRFSNDTNWNEWLTVAP